MHPYVYKCMLKNYFDFFMCLKNVHCNVRMWCTVHAICFVSTCSRNRKFFYINFRLDKFLFFYTHTHICAFLNCIYFFFRRLLLCMWYATARALCLFRTSAALFALLGFFLVCFCVLYTFCYTYTEHSIDRTRLRCCIICLTFSQIVCWHFFYLVDRSSRRSSNFKEEIFLLQMCAWVCHLNRARDAHVCHFGADWLFCGFYN